MMKTADFGRYLLHGGTRRNEMTLARASLNSGWNVARWAVGKEPADAGLASYAKQTGIRAISSLLGVKAAKEDKLPAGWPADVFGVIAKEIETKGGMITLEDGMKIPAFRLVMSGAATLPHMWVAYIKPQHQFSDYKKVLGMDGYIEEALSQRGHSLSVRVMRGPLRVEIDRPSAEVVTLADDWELLKAQPMNRYEYLFGMYFANKRLNLGIADLIDSNECHAVVGGMTGSGKSQVSLMILLSAMLNTSPEKLSVIICDPKNKDFRPMATAAHVGGKIYTDVDECREVILAVLAEMDRRNKAGDDSAEYQRILLYIDELPDLLDQDGKDKTIENALVRLAQKGRGWGINLILAAQKATAEVFSSRLLDNMPWRMVMRVGSYTQSNHLSGQDGCLAHKLPGKGAGLFYNAEFTDGVRVQGHLVADPKQGYYAATIQSFIDDINERWAGIRPHWTPRLAEPEPAEYVQESLLPDTPRINTQPGRPPAQFSNEFVLAVAKERIRVGDAFSINSVRKLHKSMHNNKDCGHERAKALYEQFVLDESDEV